MFFYLFTLRKKCYLMKIFRISPRILTLYFLIYNRVKIGVYKFFSYLLFSKRSEITKDGSIYKYSPIDYSK